MFKIIEKLALNDTVVQMVIEAELIANKAKAGQFIIVHPTDNSERIPLTIHDHSKKDKTITIIFQIVGQTTILLNSLNVNDYILDVVGPLGNASDLEGYEKAIVIGGGVGSAIAYPVSKALKEDGCNVTSILGFRNKDLMILEENFKNQSDNLYVTTDDGSYGMKGLVTEQLENLLKDDTYNLVFVVGPLIMMKFVCLLTKKYNVKTIVSMNSLMIDGTGMCGGCRLSVGGTQKFTCIDGPDFDGHLVDFDEAIKRSQTYKPEEETGRESTCNLFKKKVQD